MPISSPYGNVSLPESDLFSFLFNRKERDFPDDRVIYQDADDASRKYTFAQVKQSAVDFAKGLRANYDIRKGDVIGLFAPNDVDTPVVIAGALYLGAIISPANPGYTVGELAYQLKDSGAKLVIAHYGVIDTVRKACAQVGVSESQIILLGAAKDDSRKFKHWTSVRNNEGTFRIRAPKITPKSDLAFLVYSSGTTGKPKGVRLTHHNLSSNVVQASVGEEFLLTWNGSKTVPGIPSAPPSGDKILSCLPFFHIYGLTVLVLTPLYLGLTTIVLAKYEIEKWCRLVQEHKITFSYIVPPMVVLLSKHPSVTKYDLSSIRMTNSGAAPLTSDLVSSVHRRTGIRIKQGYGLSETSPTIFMQRWSDWQTTVGSTGLLVPNCVAKFCPPSNTDAPGSDGSKELPAGETGELYVKGPNVFLGYHNNEPATRDCLSKDGWFRTGDVGYLDKQGNLYITDRVKELIKYKGFQVPPAELEGYLIEHESVDDVAVVGVESVELGTEVPRAYVVRKAGLPKSKEEGEKEEKAIVDWLRGRVANHKRLRGGVGWVDQVPKSASGKILRRVLRDRAREEWKGIEQERMSRGKAKL